MTSHNKKGNREEGVGKKSPVSNLYILLRNINLLCLVSGKEEMTKESKHRLHVKEEEYRQFKWIMLLGLI